MTGLTERVMDKTIKYGSVFAEVGASYGNLPTVDTPKFNPIAKAVFGFASVTVEVRAHCYHIGVSEASITLNVQLLKEQNKYDQIPLSLFDRLQRVLPLADRVADEIVCEETDILEEIIPRMYKVIQEVAEYSCDYVRRGRLGKQSLF
jgi:hypothetical protein